MKKIIMIAIFVIVGLGFSMSDEMTIISKAESVINSGTEILTTDRIIRKIRVYKGRKQYRRWNATKKKWVDPHWIDF